MKSITLLNRVRLYPLLLRYRCKKDIPHLGLGEKAIALNFGLWGIWWCIKSTYGLKLASGDQLPVHFMHLHNGEQIVGQRDLTAADGTKYEQAWRESYAARIEERLSA